MSRVPIRIPSHSKYHAKRTDGYASKAEAKRGAELELLEKLGQITGLTKQPSFTLIPKDALGSAVVYRADFMYHPVGSTGMVVEDVKGFKTAVYKLKRRLMWKVFGIEIVEI